MTDSINMIAALPQTAAEPLLKNAPENGSQPDLFQQILNDAAKNSPGDVSLETPGDGNQAVFLNEPVSRLKGFAALPFGGGISNQYPPDIAIQVFQAPNQTGSEKSADGENEATLADLTASAEDASPESSKDGEKELPQDNTQTAATHTDAMTIQNGLAQASLPAGLPILPTILASLPAPGLPASGLPESEADSDMKVGLVSAAELTPDINRKGDSQVPPLASNSVPEKIAATAEFAVKLPDGNGDSPVGLAGMGDSADTKIVTDVVPESPVAGGMATHLQRLADSGNDAAVKIPVDTAGPAEAAKNPSGPEMKSETKNLSGLEVQPKTIRPSGMTIKPDQISLSGMEIQPASQGPSDLEIPPHTVTASGIKLQPDLVSLSGMKLQPNLKTISGMELRSGLISASGLEAQPNTMALSGMELQPGTITPSGIEMQADTISLSGVEIQPRKSSLPESSFPETELRAETNAAGIPIQSEGPDKIDAGIPIQSAKPDKKIDAGIQISGNDLPEMELQSPLADPSGARPEITSDTAGQPDLVVQAGTIRLPEKDHRANPSLLKFAEPISWEYPKEIPLSSSVLQTSTDSILETRGANFSGYATVGMELRPDLISVAGVESIPGLKQLANAKSPASLRNQSVLQSLTQAGELFGLQPTAAEGVSKPMPGAVTWTNFHLKSVFPTGNSMQEPARAFPNQTAVAPANAGTLGEEASMPISGLAARIAGGYSPEIRVANRLGSDGGFNPVSTVMASKPGESGQTHGFPSVAAELPTITVEMAAANPTAANSESRFELPTHYGAHEGIKLGMRLKTHEIPSTSRQTEGTAESAPVVSPLAAVHPAQQTEAVKDPVPTPATHRTSPEELYPQIIDKAKLMVMNGQHEMEVSLKPDHLGKIQLKVTMENQQMTAKFVAESQQVKEIIENHLPALRQHLQETGLQVDALTVATGSPNGAGQFQQQGHHSSDTAQSGSGRRQFFQERALGNEPETRSPNRMGPNSMIDFVA